MTQDDRGGPETRRARYTGGALKQDAPARPDGKNKQACRPPFWPAGWGELQNNWAPAKIRANTWPLQRGTHLRLAARPPGLPIALSAKPSRGDATRPEPSMATRHKHEAGQASPTASKPLALHGKARCSPTLLPGTLPCLAMPGLAQAWLCRRKGSVLARPARDGSTLGGLACASSASASVRAKKLNHPCRSFLPGHAVLLLVLPRLRSSALGGMGRGRGRAPPEGGGGPGGGRRPRRAEAEVRFAVRFARLAPSKRG